MSKNVFDLIQYLKVDANDFYSVLRTPDNKKYNTFTLKKKNGKDRLIEAPSDKRLIHIQERIRLFLDEEYEKFAGNRAFGYRKGKSIVDNAKQHYVKNKHRFVVKVDIRDFFNSISIERIIQLFNKGLRIPKESSNALALIVTKDRRLPQGACTSPVISNMICKKMDRELANYAYYLGAVYTRYADDLFFSFPTLEQAYLMLDQNQFPKIDVCDEFKTIIQRSGFIINNEKTRLLTHNRRQNICGIIINEKINVKRTLIRELRTKIHRIECGDTSINEKSIVGKLGYVRFVRGKTDSLAVKLCTKANSVMIPPFPDADFYANQGTAFDKYLVRIENGKETEISDSYGSGFFINGFLVTSRHVVEHGKTDPFDGVRGYFKTINISYYDEEHRFKTIHTKVLKAFLVNEEIAFLKIDAFDLFRTKCLKLIDADFTKPSKAFCCGCQLNDSSGLGVLYRERSIIGENNYMGSLGYTLERGSIYKGMSGGPLIDVDTFKVIGVNFLGSEKDGGQDINSVANKIHNRSIKSAAEWIPNDLWLLKHQEWVHDRDTKNEFTAEKEDTKQYVFESNKKQSFEKKTIKKYLKIIATFDLLVAIFFLVFLGVKQCSQSKSSNSGSSSDSTIKYDTTKLNDAFKYLVDKQMLIDGYDDTLDKVVSVTCVDTYPNTFSLNITITSENSIYFYNLSGYNYPESKEGYEDFASYLLLNDNYKSLNPTVSMEQADKVDSTNFPTTKTNNNYVVGQNNHYYFSGSYFENNNYYIYQKKEIESGADPFAQDADQVIDVNSPLYSYYQSLYNPA